MRIDTNFIQEIFAPQLHFEGCDESEKFARYFSDLYRIEIYKEGLDLILTKVREKDLSFEVKIIKGWDTNLGCYLTEQSKVFNKVAGVFSKKIKKKIIIKSFSHNVLAHEMAHALEFESGIDLGEEFRQAIGFDMKNRQADLLTLRAEIKRLMVDALKVYPQHQFLSELFARYFELLSVSKNVKGSGDFESSQVMDFFVNTTNFVKKIFNAKIYDKIAKDISEKTEMLAKQVESASPENLFQDRVGSFYKMQGENGKKTWSKNVKSNAKYQVAWQKYKEIEDKKDK
ncbi:MAG TPA: hypothetical protein VI861_03120 [Rickettsiales bacterium]|nr:hypothetical protein [Rickettsiales bacterium]